MSDILSIPPSPGLIECEWRYACWRMEYYTFAGNMTLDEIDDAVSKGLIKYGDLPPNPQDQRAGHPAPMNPVVGQTLPEQKP
jgi:hypothetical protein